MRNVSRLYVIFAFLIINFLLASYTHHNANNPSFLYYDSLYKKSVSYIENEELEKSIILLDDIVSKQRQYSNRDNCLIMNAHYDLGQIYLSRAMNYDLAINHFEYIFNNIQSTYGSVDTFSGMKSLKELKEKSLFMLGYIYHNHVGNFSISQSYYSTFLATFPNSELCFSVEYELGLINKEILNFKNK
tara:strand:+ start:824 stop:1387 length:564 start_codon:yes stop_codon:yes gene_type:complete